MHYTEATSLALLGLVIVPGCVAPSWYSGYKWNSSLQHRVEQVAVIGDSLSVAGELWTTGGYGVPAFTDYGIKVYRAVDDQGTKLECRSFQIFWMKSSCFQIEFSQPAPNAETVQLDLAFLSPSGVQRVAETYTIQRNVVRSYLNQSGRWERKTEN